MKRRVVLILLALAASQALAADRDPLEIPLRQYAAVLGVAVFGGLVSFYAKVRAGHVQAFNLMHLIGELATSAFAGLLAFWIAEGLGTPQLVTICLVGVAGHMGARAIGMFEVWAAKRWAAAEAPPRPPAVDKEPTT